MAMLSLLVLRTADLETSVEFYSALGLEFEQEQHGKGPLHYACERRDMVLELYPLQVEQGSADKTTLLGFLVESLDEVLATLGVEAEVKSSEWGRFCNLKDPDGRTVRITES